MHKLFILREERNAQALYAFLKSNWKAMAEAGKPLAIEIKPEKTKRSVEANKYHWQMLNQIAEQAWVDGRQYEAKIWHLYYCEKFLGVYELPNGKTSPLGSSDLSVEEFNTLDRKIEADAAQTYGVIFEEKDAPWTR